MTDRKEGYAALLSVAVEIALDHALRESRLKTISIEIDEALDNKDKEAFMRLTDEMKQLDQNNDIQGKEQANEG
jgi:uncharacterized protein YpiB (UPF0302 family)